jgi:hypothetical protein
MEEEGREVAGEQGGTGFGLLEDPTPAPRAWGRGHPCEMGVDAQNVITKTEIFYKNIWRTKSTGRTVSSPLDTVIHMHP